MFKISIIFTIFHLIKNAKNEAALRPLLRNWHQNIRLSGMVTPHCGLNKLNFLVIVPKKTPMLPNSTIRVMAKACVMEITHPFAPVGYTRPSARNAAV